ncbi:12478_t:CDS:2, partial [Gigaspora margarita]
MASSDTQIGVIDTQQEVSSTTNQNTLPIHDEGLGEVKKLDKDAILSDTSLVGDINPDNLEKSSNSVQSALFTHEGGLEKIEKLKDVFSDANLISDGIPDNDNTLVDSVPSSIEMTDNPIVVEESTNDISASIIIPRTAGTGSEHSTSANSPTVSNMTVSSESSKHSRSGSQTRKKGPPPKVPPKSGKVVNWIPQKKENDLPKQNPEAPLKKVPSSNQLEELQDQNNTRLKNKVPPDTLQETNKSSEVLFKEVEIKDRSNIISKKDIEPLDVSQETINSEINLSKQNPETPFKELKEEETASRNSSHTIPEIDLSKQQPKKTLRDSYQTKPEEHMTFESIYEDLAKKGIVENNPPPAIPPKPNVSTSYETPPEVMNLDEIHKRLGLSDSQSTPMPYLPNNNLPDSKDENAPPSTDDKTNSNSLVITSAAPISQFNIGTYENPPLINNDNNEM